MDYGDGKVLIISGLQESPGVFTGILIIRAFQRG